MVDISFDDDDIEITKVTKKVQETKISIPPKPKILQLKGINIDNIKKVHNIDFTTSFKRETKELKEKKEVKEKKPAVFIEDGSRLIELYICLHSDIIKGHLPIKTDIVCYIDCHSFSSPPLFCPVREVPSFEIITDIDKAGNHNKTKKYLSSNELGKMKLQIKNNEARLKELHKLDKLTKEEEREKQRLLAYKKPIYEEGIGFEGTHIFCSWNCLQTFVLTKANDKIYRDSRNLIPKLYKYITGNSLTRIIKPAPDRETLKMFGGFLSIEEYRANFDKVEFFSLNQYERSYKSLYITGKIYEKITLY